MSRNLIFGKAGEKAALKLLKDNDYRIIATNYSCPIGEIDIIAVKNDVLVAVEVKSRKSKHYGLPEEAVTNQKLNKIARILDFYCSHYKKHPRKRRIDVVALLYNRHQLVSQKIVRGV